MSQTCNLRPPRNLPEFVANQFVASKFEAPSLEMGLELLETARNFAFFCFSFLRRLKEPPRDSPRNSPRTSGRSVRPYVFHVFMNLAGRRVQIGKFNNRGG